MVFAFAKCWEQTYMTNPIPSHSESSTSSPLSQSAADWSIHTDQPIGSKFVTVVTVLIVVYVM